MSNLIRRFKVLIARMRNITKNKLGSDFCQGMQTFSVLFQNWNLQTLILNLWTNLHRYFKPWLMNFIMQQVETVQNIVISFDILRHIFIWKLGVHVMNFWTAICHCHPWKLSVSILCEINFEEMHSLLRKMCHFSAVHRQQQISRSWGWVTLCRTSNIPAKPQFSQSSVVGRRWNRYHSQNKLRSQNESTHRECASFG